MAGLGSGYLPNYVATHSTYSDAVEDCPDKGLLTIIQTSKITPPVCIENAVITLLSGEALSISSDPVCSK